MTWDAIGAIGQMLGSLAVLITLGYLAVQVRHARTEMRRSISHNRLDALRGHLSNRTNNERLQTIAMKAVTALGIKLDPFQTALMERTGLTREESIALTLDMQTLWLCYAEALPYADQLRDGERTAFEIGLRNAYSTPLGALWYGTAKSLLDPEAVRYVDNLLAQPR
jgi:hypothetical protein